MKFGIALLIGLAAACAADADKDRLEATTKASYDPESGKLSRLTYDANKNGVIDTWTYMDGATVLRSEMDANEDGTIDRWEHHGEGGRLEKIGVSRADDGKPDAWAIPGAAEGQIDHVEVSTKRDDKIDRWEWYDGDILTRAAEDTNGDRKPDKWETYAGGELETVAFDENGDGAPDRRLTYAAGALQSIESAPDGSGAYKNKIDVAVR